MSWHIAHVQLLDYFVKSFSFETNMKCEKEKPRDLRDVVIQNDWRPLKKHKNRYAVFLNLEMRAPEGKNTPYAIKMEMFGYFQVPDEMPEELREKMVKTNGSSILYGAAREIIREMTSRGIFRKIYFPTVSFARIEKNTKQEIKQTKAVKSQEA